MTDADAVKQSIVEHSASEHEFSAALMLFGSACMRGNSKQMVVCTERAHNALQAFLDAKASMIRLSMDAATKGMDDGDD